MRAVHGFLALALLSVVLVAGFAAAGAYGPADVPEAGPSEEPPLQRVDEAYVRDRLAGLDEDDPQRAWREERLRALLVYDLYAIRFDGDGAGMSDVCAALQSLGRDGVCFGMVWVDPEGDERELFAGLRQGGFLDRDATCALNPGCALRAPTLSMGGRRGLAQHWQD